jgi:hypothetical protein
MAGKHVTQPGDQLSPLSVERMYQGLTKPRGNLPDLVQQLRSLKTIDPKAYRSAKTQLPYVVCGYFTPAIRRKEHFAFIEHFIIDIDKLSHQSHSPEGVKRLLQQDERVALLFTSPGNDGVKALFNLQTRIHDAGYYSLFYKRFAAKLALQYRLEGLIDLVTSDVSRCCFMSFDADAWFNPAATPVEAETFLNPNNIEGMQEALEDIKAVEDTIQKNLPEENKASATPNKQSLPDDVLWQIKQKLNPALAAKQPKVKEYIQPQELTEAIAGLTESLAALGITVAEHKPISYGKQLKLKAGNHWAEVNLFYGKNQFKAVQTTKTGSNKQLADMAAQAIQLHFDNRQ